LFYYRHLLLIPQQVGGSGGGVLGPLEQLHLEFLFQLLDLAASPDTPWEALDGILETSCAMRYSARMICKEWGKCVVPEGWGRGR
jgi:hypothetical protein